MRVSDKIRELQDALHEAQKIGLKQFSETRLQEGHFELFMLGEQILSERLNVMKKTTVFPAFIGQLLALNAQKEFYSQLNVSSTKAKFYRLDGPIQGREGPVFPQRKLTLLLGMFLGLMVGLFGSLLSNSYKWWGNTSRRDENTLVVS